MNKFNFIREYSCGSVMFFDLVYKSGIVRTVRIDEAPQTAYNFIAQCCKKVAQRGKNFELQYDNVYKRWEMIFEMV